MKETLRKLIKKVQFLPQDQIRTASTEDEAVKAAVAWTHKKNVNPGLENYFEVDPDSPDILSFKDKPVLPQELSKNNIGEKRG